MTEGNNMAKTARAQSRDFACPRPTIIYPLDYLTRNSIDGDMLTREDAADFLGVAAQTLAVWAMTGRYDLPYIKIGRLVRYRKSDLEDFIKQRTF